MSRRAGHAVTELVVTLVLSAIVATALTAVLLTQLRVVRLLAARIAITDAVRLVLHVLPTELRLASPEADLHTVATDSLSARWPRLSGVACASAPGRVWVRVGGMRTPDPEKDSLLVVSARGEEAFGFGAATEEPGACPGYVGQRIYRLDTVGQAAAGTAVLVFEGGTYYLQAEAFRYRIGREGRQPLTDEAFRDAASQFTLRLDSTAAWLRIQVAPRSVFGEPAGQPVSARVTFLNVATAR